MSIHQLAADSSPGAMAALDQALPEVVDLENRLQAQNFAHKCLRETEEDARRQVEEARLDRIEHIATETLEVFSSIGAGALSCWTVGPKQVPVGGLVNGLLGTGAKIGCLLNPNQRALRSACRVGKSMLQTQLGITTRRIVRGEL
ncbi:hypothetical protein [Plesiocystis pacifica]|nr:hypothetical protein [Plesiocystis pacifica]